MTTPAVARPRLPLSERPPLLGRLPLIDRLAAFEDRVALVDGSDEVTYGRLAELMEQAGARLSVPGERQLVVLELGNTADAVVAYLGALAGGHVPLLAPPGRPEVRTLLTAAYPGPHHVHPELALLLSTSGTTGSPKLVRLSAENLQSNAESVASALAIRPDDRAITSFPLHYCYGLSVLHSHLLVGASVVLTDRSVTDPAFWDLMRDRAVTTLGDTGGMVPVIALSGFLGAGKTTVLNHLLRRPGARVGVVVNDFGAINVDAGLVTGQVDAAASITGGCVCCLPDNGGLDEALEQLTHPRLRMDAVIVEASGAADPLALARLIRFSGAEHARPGGLVDVVDAVEHRRTVDTGQAPPPHYQATTLVVLNKIDRLPPDDRERVIADLSARVRQVNPLVPVVPAVHGRIDPALVYDVADDEDPPDQLPLAALARAEHSADHVHAAVVTVEAAGPVEAEAVVDLLESPPAGVYRLKGCVPVRTGRGQRRYVVNLVGHHVHVATAPPRPPADGLVAIGMDLDQDAVRKQLTDALRPGDGPVRTAGLRRLQRLRRLST